ncbi:uncharacterized protein LOC108488044 [Gossypium arboreum]|uniref:uncharacterized protein LOC108488044 n=1 Tax=Gossypium arboreum TaxID=29729 RepID=UPI0022F1ADC4|nr:uncharacterized protein LOC108488044 [Gossypium arboreum]
MTCCNNSATGEFKIRCGISTIACPSYGHNICSQDEGIHDYLPGLPSGVTSFIMSNLTKLEFVALDITGNNYLSWVLDAEIHLDAKGLGEAIKEGNEESTQDKAKAMIFLRHHLHEGLKAEYLTVKGPQILWANLKERYDHQKTVILPKAHYEWLDLRLLQDFKSTQYREKGFQKYSELISCLLVAEQNNELLMKNHELRPTGSVPFPEANVSLHNGQELKETHHANSSVRSRGHRYGYGRGGRFKNSHSYQKWDRKNGNREKKEKCENVTNVCYRCGGKGHGSHVCRTQKHLVDLYQQSIKQKGKKVETNLMYKDGEGDFDDGNATHLEVTDFLSTPKGNY